MHANFSETSSIKSLLSLKYLSQVEALNGIGIFSLRDLAEFTPCRYAQLLLGSIENGTIFDLELKNYLDSEVAQDATPDEIRLIAKQPIINIKGIGETYEKVFNSNFFVNTIEDLANFSAFKEAQSIILNKINDTFYEKPSAPKELIPELIGSTHTQVRFNNYVKEKEHIFDSAALQYLSAPDEPFPEQELIDAFTRHKFKFHLGYLALFKQKWINAGTHLGEILHSVALAPGESRNIAFLDWHSRQASSRSEDTSISEQLSSEFYQNRALNEVVQTTASEHQIGKTEIDATTETSGTSKTSGFGGGASTGASGKADLTSVTGFPLEVSGAGLASFAGSTGKSKVYSESNTQGTLTSETSGERSVLGQVTQNISDSTVQNSSNVRSLMSTVIIEDTQSGGQSVQTRNITNYNHSHALTMQYFEVLQKYNTNTYSDKLTPVLYLPFNPVNFNISIVRKYWTIFGEYLKQVLPREKFLSYDQVIKDFNPSNGAFDYSGNVHINKIKIRRSKQFSKGVRVTLDEANPPVTLNIRAQDMNDALDLIVKGGATYIDYHLLRDPERDVTRFGNRNSISLSENITLDIKSDFKRILEQKMRWYLDKDSGKTRRTSESNKEDNEIGIGSNRSNLQQDVRDENYILENESDFIEFSLDIEYELIDSSGNYLVITQNYDNSITFFDLYNGYDEEGVINISDHIQEQLVNSNEINPIHTIKEIENHFRTNKYGYTKYLLNYIEKEQIIDLIEHLGIIGTNDNIPLTKIIDPNPLGITENLLIFKLKEAEKQSSKILESLNFSGTYKINNKPSDRIFEGIGTKKETTFNGITVIHYSLRTENTNWLDETNSNQDLDFYISKQANADGKHRYFGKIISRQNQGSDLHTNEIAIQGFANKADAKKITFSYKQNIASVEFEDDKKPTGKTLVRNISLTLNFSYEKVIPLNVEEVVNGYIQNLEEYENIMKKKQIKSTVFLPTNGVFGEAILGLSNASEYINISRFYDWQDSPIPNNAPNILGVDVNQNLSRGISESLNPNVPVSVLNQISPQQMPDTSLNTALGAIQNGNIFRDMSKSSELSSTLKDLSSLANNTAQLSGNLSGEAASNALNAAVELGKQVAGMVNTAMGTNVASPPETQTAKGATRNAIEEMPTEADGTLSPTDNAIAGAIGAPVNSAPQAETSATEGESNAVLTPEGGANSEETQNTGSAEVSAGAFSGIKPSLTNTKVEIVLRAFIPSAIVKMDPSWMTNALFGPVLSSAGNNIAEQTDYFSGIGGDDRLTPNMLSDFSYGSTDYRAQAKFTIDFNSVQAYSPTYPNCADWGDSKIYFASDIQPINGAPLSWMFEKNQNSVQPDSIGTKIVNSSNFDVTVTKVTPTKIKAVIKINGNLPLVTLSPALNLWFEVTFEQKSNQITFDGYIQHDGFPSYELYFNGNPHYTHDCIAQGRTPFDLGPQNPAELIGTNTFWGEYEQTLRGVI